MKNTKFLKCFYVISKLNKEFQPSVDEKNFPQTKQKYSLVYSNKKKINKREELKWTEREGHDMTIALAAGDIGAQHQGMATAA